MRKTIAAAILALGVSPTLSVAAQMEATVVGLDRGKGHVFVMTPEGRKSLKVGDTVAGMEHVMQGADLLVVYTESEGTINVSKIFKR